MSNDVPIGAIAAAVITLLAVRPIRRPPSLGTTSFLLSTGVNELPFVFVALAVVSTEPILSAGDVTPMGWLAVALAVLTTCGLGFVVAAALRTGRRLEAALVVALGQSWRDEIDPDLGRQLRHRLPWLRILLTPWTIWRRDVERVTDVAYAADGRSNLLDVYRHRSRPTSAPTLLYLHGGRFRWGRKSREGRPLLFHLASHGWTCISANYHLSPTPAEGFPRHLVDVKKVIAWARTDGRRYGVDPDFIVLAGSSAGAHLTMMAALTANDPTFQPGFESVDTSITAGIGLGGYYGPLGGDERPPSTPSAYLRADAPALLLIHGDHDTCTPPDGARRLVAGLRATSANTVVYAELPGAAARLRPVPIDPLQRCRRRRRGVRRVAALAAPRPAGGPFDRLSGRRAPRPECASA